MARAGALHAWRRGALYDYLLTAERSAFAWEWLRRTAAYQLEWARLRGSEPTARYRAAHRFGLVMLPPPTSTALEAQPIWCAAHDPHVLKARVSTATAPADDLLDIRLLAGDAAVAFDEEDAEHWRIDIIGHSVRIDVHGGTLLGGPTLLHFELPGLATARPKLAPVDLLIRRVLSLGPKATQPHETRAARWIGELRTADALAAGANQQEIARALFSRAVPAGSWRAEGESYRLRVQRLVRSARARLRNPLDRAWFR